MKTVFLAEIETRHFSFEALGATEQEASETMDAALAQHAISYGIPYKTLRASCWDDLTMRELRIGSGYRDHEQIVPKP